MMGETVRTVRGRRLAVALSFACSIGVLASWAVPARADADPLFGAAHRALHYLSTQQQADGSIDHSASETDDYILGTAAIGANPNALIASSGNSVYDFLAADITDATSTANRTGKLVQALVAGHRNPRNFAGEDLLTKLEGPRGTAGGFYDPATGAFNTGGNAAFEQANSILGLEAAHNRRFPVTPKAIAFLKSLQDTSGPGAGGWPADGTDNTNSTAMALMALAAACDHSADSAAFAFLHTQQDPASGGFAFTTLGPFGSPSSDPDSDALVIQGLVAAGQDPDSATWTNSAGNALTDIVTFQDPVTGGFAFLHGIAPDAFTTTFVPAGLLERPFPILRFS
jgi:hypothetical protein